MVVRDVGSIVACVLRLSAGWLCAVGADATLGGGSDAPPSPGRKILRHSAGTVTPISPECLVTSTNFASLPSAETSKSLMSVAMVDSIEAPSVGPQANPTLSECAAERARTGAARA